MRIDPSALRVLVFDFDGTLVDSNRIKHAAYFDLFPDLPAAARVIRSVLADPAETSRYEAIAEMVARLAAAGLIDGRDYPVDRLTAAYGRQVLQAVVRCPAMPGALELLEKGAARWPLFLSSTTPEPALREIIRQRGWNGFFKGLYGYPRKKAATLAEIMRLESIVPRQILVIGDGASDAASAEETNCLFFDASQELKDCISLLELG